jgi:ATP-binding cassette subfamily B protein
MIVCTIALLTVEAACALILPAYMADIINQGVMLGNIPFIWRTGVTMLLITIFSTVVAVSTSYFAARIGTGVAGDLRAAVFKKVLSFSSAEMNHFSSSSLITRSTNDIIQVQLVLIMGMRLLVYAPILGVGGIIRALERDVCMSWIVAAATFIMVACMVALFFIVMPKYKKLQKLIDRLNLVSRENLSGILIVRAFSTQKFEKQRFEKANRDLTNTSLFVDQAFAVLSPIILLVLNVTTVVIVWVGARRAAAFQIDVGDIFAFLQYGMLVIFAFLMVGVMFIFLPRSVVCANRIKEVLETRSSLQYKEDAEVFSEDFKGVVEFRNVTFRYPDATEDDDNILEDVSFTAEPGKTTAIIGATGSGKSTIFKLFLRFYDTSSGGVYFDNINVKDVKKEALLDKIGYIPQKASLFSGSIRSNLM